MKEGGLSTRFVLGWGSFLVLGFGSGAHLSIASSREDQATLEAGCGGASPKRAVRRPDELRRLPQQLWVRTARCV